MVQCLQPDICQEHKRCMEWGRQITCRNHCPVFWNLALPQGEHRSQATEKSPHNQLVLTSSSEYWPYNNTLKNLIVLIIWYLPAGVERQTATLLWLSRLSKYTLVHIFAVVGLLVRVQLQLNVGGVDAITCVEPRFGIIAFFWRRYGSFADLTHQSHARAQIPRRKTAPRPRNTFVTFGFEFYSLRHLSDCTSPVL